MLSDSRPRTGELEQASERQARLFRIISIVTALGAVGILSFFVLSALLTPNPLFSILIPIVIAYFLGAVVSAWLGWRGQLNVAIPLYVVSSLVGMLASTYLFNGVTGPAIVVLIVLPVTAGLLLGRRAARWTAAGVIVPYLIMSVLEALGVLSPLDAGSSLLRLSHGGLFLVTVVIAAVISGLAFDLTEGAVKLVRERSARLAEISRQAEESARLEREAREREERIARQLRRAISQYTDFLERVSAGDYTARLALDDTEWVGGESEDLLLLGQRLNQTVDSLVTALDDLQRIQRRYVREAWEAFLRAGAAHRGFRLQGEEIAPDETAWLASMTRAVQERGVVASDRELAVPLLLRGEVIGTLGVRREDGREWGEDEIALIAAIGDQLAQTIESLRLLDETQRRAAREESSRQTIARIRETLDIEEVLRAAVREIHESMGIPEVAVRLVSQESGSQGGEER